MENTHTLFPNLLFSWALDELDRSQPDLEKIYIPHLFTHLFKQFIKYTNHDLGLLAAPRLGLEDKLRTSPCSLCRAFIC